MYRYGLRIPIRET